MCLSCFVGIRLCVCVDASFAQDRILFGRKIPLLTRHCDIFSFFPHRSKGKTKNHEKENGAAAACCIPSTVNNILFDNSSAACCILPPECSPSAFPSVGGQGGASQTIVRTVRQAAATAARNEERSHIRRSRSRSLPVCLGLFDLHLAIFHSAVLSAGQVLSSFVCAGAIALSHTDLCDVWGMDE
jgi:hypothetical protein